MAQVNRLWTVGYYLKPIVKKKKIGYFNLFWDVNMSMKLFFLQSKHLQSICLSCYKSATINPRFYATGNKTKGEKHDRDYRPS